MAAISLKQQVSAMADFRDERALTPALAAIVDAIQNLATKLDADATVTGTDFASTTAAIIID